MRAVSRRGLVVLAIVALQAALLPLGLAAAQDSLQVDEVVDGLRNPRQLDIADGHLFIAEAGVGGDECFEPVPEEPDFVMCYGTTSRVSAIDLDMDTWDVVVPDLPSMAGDEGPDEPFGWFAVGAHDVALSAPDAGVVIMGLGAPPEVRDLIVDEVGPGANALGTLLHADFDTEAVAVAADLAEYEQVHNPDGGDPEEHGIDTNPYSVLLDGDDAIAVDAGGNSLLRVPLEAGQTPTNDIETVAVFPPNPQPFPPFIPAPRGALLPADSVPTAVTFGADDDYLVGELPGFPFQPGAARVWSVDADGEEVEPELHADGFATIIDLAVHDGDLYVLEMANLGLLAAETGGDFRGALVRYDGDTGRREVLLADPLFAPAGLAFDDDGTLYISNCGVCGDDADAGPTGQILRVTGVEDAEPIVYTQPASAETDENQPVELDVLPDDVDGLAIRAVVDRGQGAVAVEDGTLIYQPAAHFSGTDRIKYQACTDEACVIGEVTIAVGELPTGRYDGANRVETAIRISRGHFPAGADAVVIARADLYPDALAGGVLAAAADAPVLLTRSDRLQPAVVAELDRLQPSTAYILGGTAALSAAVEDAVVDDTPVEEAIRVAGVNRFATAAEVRAEVEDLTGEDATEVYVAEGQHANPERGWPDALAVSYLAGHEAKPILLVTHGAVPDATRAALEDGVAAATIVGGEAAVSAEVAQAIAGIVDDVDRVAGADRYETSTAIAERAIAAGMDPDVLYLATGRNWPDALAAGPAVAVDGSVLLLVDRDSLDRSPAVAAYLAEHRPFGDIDLLGGTAAISAAVEQQVRTAAAGG